VTDKQAPDWERIEHLYRAGLLSVREIAAGCGVSHTAIQKKAKAGAWERDLKAKIAAKADALVAKAEVATLVATETLATERGIVDSNAQIIANIRIGHRTDIARYRRLASKLLDELEDLTDNRDLFDQVGELLASPDDNGIDKLNDLYRKVIDLPSRTKTLKELGETLKNLITLERQAYDVGTEQPQDDRSKLTEDELDRRIAKLAGQPG
jgi:chaperonin cofactor prefoldin